MYSVVSISNGLIEKILDSQTAIQAREDVQKDPDFIEELEKATEELIDKYVKIKLGVAWSKKWEAQQSIRREVNARLAVTAIDTFDNVVDNVQGVIDVRDHLLV